MAATNTFTHHPAMPIPVPGGQPGTQAYLLSGTRFDLPLNYEPIKLIGKGAYGVVCSAKEKTHGVNVAIKKIPKAFHNLTDTKRTLREIKLLRHFNHENIISILDIFKPASKAAYEDIYLVSDLMDTDLSKIISSRQALSDDHCQYFLYQILRGLKYIHSANVLHRDLKPSNLLINGDCLLKIADFGLARLQEDQIPYMTEYVATRWYRAPEVILSWKMYSKSIDVWSVGCIFAEFFLRKPLFQGKNFIDQIKRITEIIGTPTDTDIDDLTNEDARKFARSLGTKPGLSFHKMFPTASPLAMDLLQRMLEFNPSRRITVEAALAHPYLSSLHDLRHEPTAHAVFDFDFERWQLNKETYQELIWREMLSFHPEALEEEKLHQQQEELAAQRMREREMELQALKEREALQQQQQQQQLHMLHQQELYRQQELLRQQELMRQQELLRQQQQQQQQSAFHPGGAGSGA
eukprot:CAMPEP_0174242746 /NCGR_PEP_ID=MMETSP0417-20130205/29011_1 /TAXON_ID=242541 /ORGANISM="Mayorella sp, Strain BSH-02190019" /LENGTH=463 /DNA_ID=CAMNT_0015322173 /DNA_START=28 /DNA_END=1415 /DNA_ORIENTATION=-